MSAFGALVTTAMDVQAATFGDAGTFTAPPAGPVPVRVVLARHDPAVVLPGFETHVRAAGWEALLLQTEVPTRPRPGIDTLTVGATTYTIKDVFEDAERTQWACDVS